MPDTELNTSKVLSQGVDRVPSALVPGGNDMCETPQEKVSVVLCPQNTGPGVSDRWVICVGCISPFMKVVYTPFFLFFPLCKDLMITFPERQVFIILIDCC